jgi:hypothetical protein
MVIGQQDIGGLLPQSDERCDLLGQNLQRQPRILFGVIHMPHLQAPVLIMLDQMVIGVARKGQRIEPQRINRPRRQNRQSRAVRSQIRQIVAQDVMPHHMRRPVAQRL